MAKNGKNLTYLRASNQGEVLKTILLSGTSTRLELASRLNLTSMSISYITGDLLERGFLTEVEKSGPASTPGRHSSKLAITPGSITAIGISIERHSVYFTLTDIIGNVLYKSVFKLDEDTTQQFLTSLIFENVQKILDAFPDSNILGIGVSNVGIVDTGVGIVYEPTNFFGIRDWPIGDILYGRFQIPTYIVEDMKASALAESFYGTAKNFTDFVYLGITHGVAIGTIYNGNLFEGHNGFAGEIGHTTLHYHGIKCACGNRGCLERYISVPAILEKAKLKTWEEFLAFCEKNPKNKVLSDLIEDLSVTLITLSNIFDPQAIVIGHEGATLSSICYEKLQKYLDEHGVTRRIRKTIVTPSSIADKVSLISAPSVIFSKLFMGEIKL